MTFEQFQYVRPDLEALSKSFEAQLAIFETAASVEDQEKAFAVLCKLREEFQTMYNLCYVRHTSNIKNAFYEKENEWFDATLPAFEGLNNRYFRALLEAPFRQALEEKYGPHLFVIAAQALKTFEPTLIDELGQENVLCSEYLKLKAQAQVEFEGKHYNLTGLVPFELSDDRETRRRALAAKWRFYENQGSTFEDIFDRLVHLRHAMAVKLGYKNFVELGYARMGRSDYTPEMVANFRRQVRELIVPLASRLYERQRERLGLKELKFYDEEYKFPSGNPKPRGSYDEIIANASQMYRELSPQTDAFFQYMLRAHLMDLVNRDEKVPGGYCTYMSGFKAPFIFSNFNGTSGDIDVLTHEAGHAFQVWSSQHFPFHEYHWPTSESAEIHSMSMEFFTWPWMEKFFGPETDKYCFMHMAGALQFLPYGVAVDEFQHIIYENPDLTPAERNTVWRNLEKTYQPHHDYDGNGYLEAGHLWQKQNHIFVSPFYYIDYTLAQICAFQFWMRDRHNHACAWADYVKLCQAGGSKSFLGLVELAGLRSPFEDGCVESVAGEIQAYLDGVDDSKF